MKLAIDFGTTNTVIARWADGAQLVTLPGLSTAVDGIPPLIPSLVYVCDGRAGMVTVGQAVREQQLDSQHDNRLFSNFKRGTVAQPASEARVIDGAPWTDRSAGEAFLRSLLTALPDQQVEQLVLTAPIAAFENYLSWLEGILGNLAEQTYIVDESTAAALGYAVTEPGAPVLVFDFGGGTLDLSLVQLPESRETTGRGLSRLRRSEADSSTARVIAKAGRVVGGSDIDQWLLALALQHLNLTVAYLGDRYAALLASCEQAKIRLSTEETATIAAEIDGTIRNISVTCADLERLLEINGFYDTVRHLIDKVMSVSHRSGIFREDVKYVLLVGGIALIPSVQAVIKEYFADSIVRADKPFTAVAEGALQIAAGYGLNDYLNQSYSLRYFDPASGVHRYEEIIPMGSAYPMDRPIEVELSAAHDGQTAVELVIGTVGAESSAMLEVRYEGGQTVFIAQADTAGEQIVPLNAHDPLRVRLDPPGKRDEKRLLARFVIDEQRRLRLTVIDVKTRRQVLTDAVIAALGADGKVAGQLTGDEPQLVHRPSGQRRLSLRGVATMLNLLAPEAISLDVAEAALRSDAFGARYAAAVALSQRGDRDARAVMERVLTDANAPSRATAARHLNGFTWHGAEPLFRRAVTDPDARVREAAIYSLCDLHDLHAYRLMAEALQNEENNVREAATVGLRDCQDPAAVPVLKAALLAQDPDVRVKALEALSNTGAPTALLVVRSALVDPHPDVLYAATLSLLELAREHALDELAAQIGASRGQTREAILRAFFHATNYLNINPAGFAGIDVLLDALENALHDNLPNARMAAFWPLAWMRHERAKALLKQAYINEASSEVKAHLVRVAVALMSPVGDTLLQEAMNSLDPAVKQAALRIVEARERAGVVLHYDETAAPGKGFKKPSAGR